LKAACKTRSGNRSRPLPIWLWPSSNKRLLGRSGTWADEEVFSAELLARNFPERTFDHASMDRRFANLILWFGWRVT
jgi:hypothetical protein